ncbi:MAG: hypothetical protein IPK25_14510 [Saprospiraceae bacterium]|nr:hypothetical protein [Saprospiraceae bacterium]
MAGNELLLFCGPKLEDVIQRYTLLHRDSGASTYVGIGTIISQMELLSELKFRRLLKK